MHAIRNSSRLVRLKLSRTTTSPLLRSSGSSRFVATASNTDAHHREETDRSRLRHERAEDRRARERRCVEVRRKGVEIERVYDIVVVEVAVAPDLAAVVRSEVCCKRVKIQGVYGAVKIRVATVGVRNQNVGWIDGCSAKRRGLSCGDP